MPAASGVREGLAIASGVLALAIILAWRQWVERRDRDPELSDIDHAYFARKDARRFWGTGLLVFVAAGMFRGLTMNWRANLAASQQFVWIWAGVLVLLCVLVVMAMIDWQANLAYARRHRREILEARRALIAEESRLRQTSPSPQPGFSNGEGITHEGRGFSEGQGSLD